IAFSLIQSWLLLHLLRQHGRILLRMDNLEHTLGRHSPGLMSGLPVGSLAPFFELPNPAGETVSLTSLTQLGSPVLLIFSEPRCNPCKALWPAILQWNAEHRSVLTIAVVSRIEQASGIGEDISLRFLIQ